MNLIPIIQPTYVLRLLLVICPVMLNGQFWSNDLERWDLIGKVKYMEECEYLPATRDGKIVKGKRPADGWNFEKHIFFNKSGNLVKDEKYLDTNQLIFRTIYTYDKWGKKIREKTEAIDVTRNSCDTKFKYDSIGNMVERYSYYSDSSTENYQWVYDERRNIIISEYYIDHVIHEKFIDDYNEKNQRVKSVLFFGPNNTVGDTSLYEYDFSGNCIRSYDLSEGIPLLHYTSVFNDKNQQIATDYNDDWEFDEESNTVIPHEYMIFTFEYDDHGHIVLEHIKNLNDSYETTRRIQYTYDKKGNWITKIIYKDNKPTSFFERKIKYY